MSYIKLTKKIKSLDELREQSFAENAKFLRPELLEFAMVMEYVLRKHDGEKKDSWKTCDINYLYCKLEEESNEVKEEIFKEKFVVSDNLKSYHLRDELVDLANICFMLHRRAGRIGTITFTVVDKASNDKMIEKKGDFRNE